MQRSRRLLVTVLVVVATAVAAVLGAGWVVDRLRPARCVFQAAGAEVVLTPEQAANAATIAGVAVARGLPARAATIALATAIQESKLRNLRYGHADSQGLFQQRPSQGWGSVEQVTDPVYASNAFYDALERVPGWQEGVVTEVAQEVQRSAFPTAYADHEWEGRVLASVLTGQEGGSTVMGCDLKAPEAAGDPAATAAKLERQLGVPATPETSPDATTVTVDAADETQAWALAAWAVAHAEAEQIVAVEVAGRAWDRDSDPLAWPPADPDAGSDDPADPTTVVIRLRATD
ncbi:hypothetical protein [Ornithinimicrobium panacihumi]|uniref:hypothetical protein n=1 Tax=Ornithinimicrobium panacihumi TaxID=2008449 RepID=UPI003F8A2D78